MSRLLAALVLTVLPAASSAHPHVFVETRVAVVLDGAGRFTGVRLTWVYDDFFSFLITAEVGADPDGDMILTDEELAAVSAFVLDWPAEFGGDLHVAGPEGPLDLGPRSDAQVGYAEGRVSESHFRPLAPPLEMTGPVTVQVYDPFYYTAYDLVGPVTLEGGAGCAVTVQKADLNAAYSLVDELLYGRPASDVGPDEEFPEVGYAFADTVTVTCPG